MVRRAWGETRCVSSDEGEGETLVMPEGQLPAEQGDRWQARVDAPASPEKGRVLVVDAEAGTMTTALLRAAGYATVLAEDAVAATQWLATETFHAVVTDVATPGMSGLDLLRFTQEFHRDLPVLLVTGAPDVETAAKAVELGAFQYLLKPLAPERLVASVGRAVDAQRAARARSEALQMLEDMETVTAPPGLDLMRLDEALRSMWIAYQPIVRPDGSLFAYEALLRSGAPSFRGAADLIESAERLHRLRDLGRSVRAKAGRILAEAGGDWSLFVNLHPHDLLDDSLLSGAEPLSRIAPLVVLEITERAAVHDVEDMRARMAALRAMGFRIALDDLGAGYAGLTSFVLLEPEIVKIDMELVRGVHGHAVKRRLVQSVTTLCRDMGILVVGEGVETTAERDTLIELGVDLLQGYLFGRPDRL